MGFRHEVRLSGTGGQGLLLIGKVLAEAAAVYDGKNATQSQSYGPEARGGASKSEVIISDEEIDYPKATEIDFLLCLTQESCDKYASDVKPEGTLLVDSTYVSSVPEGNYRVFQFPITQKAKDELGSATVANVVALGMISALTSVVSSESIESAILARVPKGTEDLNLKAYRLGRTLVEEAG
ncbi:MAG: 2-oxoacid:acceptor oxidoreductase family protein [Candidatus Eisenbacteria sp.]|nr:2-oxoacid:acceptor oxidoreductase family protein [Candidatus Eisenbacteria bacterium]